MGHSVERLCDLAVEFEVEFFEKIKKWTILDGYYVSRRYANSLPDSIPARVYTQDAAKDAVGLTEEIVDFVKKEMGL